MKVRVESAPSQGEGEHKASPLPCYGFASRCVHGGKGTFLSPLPEISLYVSFASKVFQDFPLKLGVGQNQFHARWCAWGAWLIVGE